MKTRLLSLALLVCSLSAAPAATPTVNSAADPQAASTSISQVATNVNLGAQRAGDPANPDPNAGITNTATISSSAGNPTGTVTFAVYRNDNHCFGQPFFQSSPQPLVNGSATFHINATQIGWGTYRWIVNYTSDQPGVFADSSSNCGAATSSIIRAFPLLKLQTSKFSATVGQTADVKATVVGGYQPFGPVTFYYSGPNDTSCSQKTAFATQSVGSDGTATVAFQPAQPGTYVLTAAFADDNLNAGASTNCSDFGDSIIVYPAGPQPAVSFKVTTPANVYAGQAFAFTVTAYDAYSNVATGYDGTVHFTSGSAGILPANSTLTNGTATFQATLNTNGSQTITATDTNNASITGTGSTYVYPQSTFVVTTAADSNDGTCDSNCSLREAMTVANSQAGPATITFDIPNMAGCTAANQCTITLSGTLPAVSDDVAINGTANNARITIDSNGWHSLNVNSGKRAVLAALKFQNASVPAAGPTGGAIHNEGTSYLSGITFYNCHANGVGGGALANTGTLDLTDCYFSFNSTSNGGSSGGALNNTGTLTISRTTFENNFAYGKTGGAIQHDGGTSTINESTFSNNTAQNGNGGAIAKRAYAIITNSAFIDNSATGKGGAILSYGNDTTVANCTFYGNQANNAAAIALDAPRAYITNCSFQGHVGSSGTINNNYNTGDVILRNVLIAGNTTGGNCIGGSSITKTDADSSTISDDTTCGSATVKSASADNLIGFPADNGGPTKTIALNPGSAAIDAGSNAFCEAPVGPPIFGAGGKDQRGVLRPQFGVCDVGAYEVGPPPAPTVSAPSYNVPVNTPVSLSDLTDPSAPPAGGGSVFSGPGVTNNIFDATGMAVGTVVTITYQVYDIYNYSSSVTFTITVTAEVSSLVVTTNGDSITTTDGVTSLREALTYAQQLGGARIVTFVPSLAGQTITLSNGWNGPVEDTALRISGDVTIDGGNADYPVTLVIPQGTQRRHLIAGGGLLQLKNLTFQGGNPPQSNSIGGAAYLYGNAELTNVRFLNNSAKDGAGLFITNTANVQVTHGLFQNNIATGGSGGGLVNAGGTLTVNDSTFTSNASGAGGAIQSTGRLLCDAPRSTVISPALTGARCGSTALPILASPRSATTVQITAAAV